MTEAQANDLIEEMLGIARAISARRSFERSAKAILDAIQAQPSATPADHLSSLQRAREAFYGLSYSEQRQLLNGWSPCSTRPDRDRFADAWAKAVIERVLLLDAHAAPDSGVMVKKSHGFQYRSTPEPVQIIVKEGTTRKEVLRALSAARDLVKSQWDNLIDDPILPRSVAFANEGKQVEQLARESK